MRIWVEQILHTRMTGNLSNTIDAFDNQDQTSGRDLLYIKPITLPYTHHDNMIWSSSYNHFNILVRGIKKMEIIVSCLSYFIWDLFDYCWIPPNYNNEIQLYIGPVDVCPAKLTKLLRAKWKIKLYIAIKYYINTIYILLWMKEGLLVAQAESRGATL